MKMCNNIVAYILSFNKLNNLFDENRFIFKEFYIGEK